MALQVDLMTHQINLQPSLVAHQTHLQPSLVGHQTRLMAVQTLPQGTYLFLAIQAKAIQVLPRGGRRPPRNPPTT